VPTGLARLAVSVRKRENSQNRSRAENPCCSGSGSTNKTNPYACTLSWSSPSAVPTGLARPAVSVRKRETPKTAAALKILVVVEVGQPTKLTPMPAR